MRDWADEKAVEIILSIESLDNLMPMERQTLRENIAVTLRAEREWQAQTVEAEREACAHIVERFSDNDELEIIMSRIAAAIRARAASSMPKFENCIAYDCGDPDAIRHDASLPSVVAQNADKPESTARDGAQTKTDEGST